MKKISLYLIACVIFLTLCSMAWVRINLLRPALIVLPAHIRNIAIIDRSMKDETPESKVEQVLTGELFKQDEQAVRQTIDGTIDVCAEFNLYQLIRTSERLKGGGTKSTFPEPMDWIQVSRLCEKHKADALLAVEIFDSDFIIANPVSIARQVLEGKILTGSGFHVTAVAGINYGVRISPRYYTVGREFYNRPRRNDNLWMGVRKSEVADWNGAIESWTQALNAKRRIAGRAAFNIAVAYEVLGDLEKAKEWAARSYTDFREKRGNDYHNMLG